MSNKGRKFRGSSEYDLIERLKQENKKLKQQISQLRKQLSRIDLDRYQNLRDLIIKYDKLEDQEAMKDAIEDLKEVWKCFECKEGYLMMMTYERNDGVHYFRKCNNCSHRTKMQKLTSKTKPGPKPDTE